MKGLATLFVVSVACLSAGQIWAQPPNSAEEQVRAVMEQARQASLVGDSNKIASLMTDEYFQTDISGHVQDKATWFKEYFNPIADLIKAGKFHWDVYERSDIQFRIYGDSAVVIGSLRLEGVGAKWSPQQHTWIADPSASFSGTLRFTHVYVRRDGKWLLAALHNAIPFMPASSR